MVKANKDILKLIDWAKNLELQNPYIKIAQLVSDNKFNDISELKNDHECIRKLTLLKKHENNSFSQILDIDSADPDRSMLVKFAIKTMGKDRQNATSAILLFSSSKIEDIKLLIEISNEEDAAI